MTDAPKPLTSIAIHDAVAHAIKNASSEVGHELAGDHGPQAWHLVGRVLRDDAQAHAFGEQVVKQLDATGIKVQQASAKIAGGHVIMGFFPVDSVVRD